MLNPVPGTTRDPESKTVPGTQKISMKTIDKIIWGFNKSYEDDKLDNLIQRN